LAGKPDVEAAATKSQEDGLGGGLLSSFLGDEGVKEAAGLLPVGRSLRAQAVGSLLVPGTSGFLVEELLVVGSLLAPGTSGFLVEELLTMALILLAGASAGASGVLGKELLATALVLPQAVDGPLPILLGAFHASTGPM
jgi:hypothetical protein